ncbi:helix-turn-helix domain-containing protein [Oricola cellulosilytica]|uniref:XRE family transcriptional regulator n=1 Tax=Oricola cellulosilytica TaxID=1429082 RepID=A0A4R0PDG4_9HYPH|nr:XRE family transcriptional regulator [Oricola cellulosilytica]TCD14603.1 XRE family transcriptional regulator [Oricola cellulosilytica]
MSGDRSVGQDIRALRNSRGITLEELSKRTGKSLGWVSQVERGLSRPSVDDLHTIARILGVPLSMFFGVADAPEEERGLIVRASARRELGQRDTGLVEALISPDLTDDFEVIHSTFLPRSALEHYRQRATSEVIYLISGRLDIVIGDRGFTINAGDSFRIKGSKYRWANPYDDPAVAIWVISPPVY